MLDLAIVFNNAIIGEFNSHIMATFRTFTRHHQQYLHMADNQPRRATTLLD